MDKLWYKNSIVLWCSNDFIKELSIMIKGFKELGKKFKSSSAELSKPLGLAIASMLLALSVILAYFANISISFLGTNTIKVGFNVVPIVVAAILYGPVVAGIVGGLSDIIGYILAPMGGYIPGFTISMILVGIIYGIAFYREDVKLPKIIVTEFIITIFINILLGVTWFVLFYGMPFDKALTIRGLKEIVDLPLSIVINFFAFKVISKIPEFRKIMKKTTKEI